MSLFNRFIPTSIHNVTFASTPLAKVVGNILSGTQQTHLLLHGDPGTGKSKIAELLIAAKYPNHGKMLKAHIFDGASWNGNSRNEILGEINYCAILGQTQHFSVINEVDLINPSLLADIREFMDDHLDHKFILTTNFAGKLPRNFLNRCSAHQVDMEPALSVASKVCQVFVDHGKFISPADALQLVGTCNGSWRTLEDLVHQYL